MDIKTKCALCGQTVDKYDICENCGWQDNDVQNGDPNYKGGANVMSLNEAKKAYRQGKNVV